MIVTPCPTRRIGALEDDKGLDAGPPELDAHRDAGEPGPDDDDIAFEGRRHPALVGVLRHRTLLRHLRVVVVAHEPENSLGPCRPSRPRFRGTRSR